MTKVTNPRLIEAAPEFAHAFRCELVRQGYFDLAGQVGTMRIGSLCRCGTPECATFTIADARYDTDEHQDNCLSVDVEGGVYVHYSREGVYEVEALSHPQLARQIKRALGETGTQSVETIGLD